MKAVLYPFRPEDPIVGLARDFPHLQWAVVGSPAEVAREIGDAAILVTSNRVCSASYGEALRHSASATLRWIHLTSAGIDGGVRMGLPDWATVTNSTGVKAAMVSEHAFALLLALVRRLPDIVADQRARRWRHDEVMAEAGTLAGAVVCVVGLGAIGRAIARKAKAFEARVIAVSRRGTAGDAIDAVYPRHDMAAALAVADAVVICTSSDPDSIHLIDAAALAAMRPKAVLVNVARGDLVDGIALIDALQAGRLGGAALDVTEIEPLAPASPLWGLPNVIISPHVAGGGSDGYQQQKDLFGRNLLRFSAGEPLLNVCRASGKP